MADRSTKQSFSRFTSALGITSNPNRPASATGAAPSSSSTASDFLAGASHLYSFGRVSDVFKSHSHLSTPRPHDGEIGGGFDGSATSKSLVKDVDSQLAALAMSPEGDRVAVAGREVLKVLTVSSNALIDTVNLRVGSRLNLNFSSNDVQWGLAASSNILATAATNGSVVIWDLAMRAPQKIDRVISEHNRAVNRIAFNQGNGSWMLSASQDGSMKLWDLRERGGARLTMLGKSEAVRDVRFNHANAVEFAAAFDNGTVQKWDIRQPRMYERKLSAHNGLALSLDWHPNGKFLVTGGRDKFIKVWDLSSDVRRPRNIITTMAPVARVAWRPGGGKNRMEIASCALVSDNRIHVWDLRRPGVANRVLDEHENVVAGLLWRDENTLWSCSKDRTFRQYDVLMAPQPVDSLSHVAFGWSPLNEFGFCIGSRPKKVSPLLHTHLRSEEDLSLKEPKGRRSGSFKMSRAGSIAGTEPGADEPLVPRQATGMMHLPGNETEAFIYLAKHYITSTTTFTIPEACEHNAQAAYRVQKYRTSQTWKMIGQAVEWEERTERARIADEANARATLEDARQMGENARQSKPRHPHLEAVRKNSGWETPESQTTARPSPVLEPEVLPDGEAATVIGTPKSVPEHNLTTSISTLSLRTPSEALKIPRPEIRSYASTNTLIPVNSQGEPQPAVSAASHPSDSTISAFSSSTDKSISGFGSSYDERSDTEPIGGQDIPPSLESQPDFPMTSNVVFPSSYRSMSTPSSFGSSQSTDHHYASSEPDDTPMEGEDKMLESQMTLKGGSGVHQHEPIRILGTKGGELRKPWAPSSLIHKVTEYYAEQADVQMCSSIALLLGERVDIPDTRLEEWQLGYIELLQRYRLFVTVAEVINATKNENVRAPGLTETQLHTGCHRCLKPLLNERTRAGYWYCERCARTLDGCTICRIPVKGQWTLCQSCGHGGHYHCMSEWFKDEGMCPSEGCGHRCLHK
ncbi:hypothetical protein G7K_4341-t1 [Saitoella complicata NRRL Y-17804]|uniref:Restriction of telomere capping protein 1 n=1 Tax=Saitoella complicata (strain BCRC 22490 / CBS 7301 / JCM 7358 / NBRC 10748 / NRRL Y-17804) TaxID=698492 RepID=A0A0E9NK42_SAICN|nr:hypothetical protein G7K_4341-t1 [Saitoella complicata NRRL Y-17804]